VAPLRV